jgi:hypothetical protein
MRLALKGYQAVTLDSNMVECDNCGRISVRGTSACPQCNQPLSDRSPTTAPRGRAGGMKRVGSTLGTAKALGGALVALTLVGLFICVIIYNEQKSAQSTRERAVILSRIVIEDWDWYTGSLDSIMLVDFFFRNDKWLPRKRFNGKMYSLRTFWH